MDTALPALVLTSVVSVACWVAAPVALEAQNGGPRRHSLDAPRAWQPAMAPPSWSPPARIAPTPHNHPLVMVAGGLAGYVVTRGLFVATDYLAHSENGCGGGLGGGELCLSSIALVASALAAPTLTPLGVHLANGSRGDLGLDVLASTTLGLAAMSIGVRTDMSWEALMVAVPVAQILGAVIAEVAASRRRAVPER